MAGADQSRKLNGQQVARAGEYLVAAQIHRCGGYAVTFAGNMPGIDLIASDVDHVRKITIQVKTKTSGTWHANTRRDARLWESAPTDVDQFWVFVDLGDEQPVYYIAPAWWVQNDIHQVHHDYLQRHGGTRARNPDSTHHAIATARIAQWRDRWDLLKIL
jgi:hypothetical protein